MISNFNNKQTRKDDLKLLIWIIVGFLFVVWLCTPPGNKFLQICFWGNNTKFIIAKLTNNYESTEYIFHRNNAVYLAKMYPKSTRALKEMDKAIKTIPAFVSDTELNSLYKDRAMIKLFLGDTKGALSDYINSHDIDFNDNLRVAMLFKEAGNYKEAMSYCNAILSTDNKAYSGYACLADLYDSAGRPDTAVRIWDLAIDRKPNNPQAYVDRARVKKKIGDYEGYNQDIKKAREYSPTIDLEKSVIEDMMHPKVLTLSIRKT